MFYMFDLVFTYISITIFLLLFNIFFVVNYLHYRTKKSIETYDIFECGYRPLKRSLNNLTIVLPIILALIMLYEVEFFILYPFITLNYTYWYVIYFNFFIIFFIYFLYITLYVDNKYLIILCIMLYYEI